MTEYFPPDHWEQHSLVPPRLVPAVVGWLARLHARFWGDAQTLAELSGQSETAETIWAVGSFYDLGKRSPAELDDLPANYAAFLARFEAAAAEAGNRDDAAFFGSPRVHQVGGRLAARAEAISTLLTAAPWERKTLVHGDAKAGNCFFAKGARRNQAGGAGPGFHGEVAAIDFQWSGVGLGVQDLAYFCHTSLLEFGGSASGVDVDALVSLYHSALRDAWPLAAACGERGQPLPSPLPSESELKALFKVAFLDFVRFTLAYSTHKLTPVELAQNASMGACIPHKRSVARLSWLLDRTADFLEEWDSGGLTQV